MQKGCQRHTKKQAERQTCSGDTHSGYHNKIFMCPLQADQETKISQSKEKMRFKTQQRPSPLAAEWVLAKSYFLGVCVYGIGLEDLDDSI